MEQKEKGTFLKREAKKMEKEALIRLICSHCDFYKESEKDLECGAFRILKALLEKGVLTPEVVEDVLRK